MIRHAGCVIFTIGVLIVGAMPAFGQLRATTADLAGHVRDQSDAVVAGVTITATNAATNTQRTAVTGPDGRFLIPALPPGTYHVSAAMARFVTETHENVTLALGSLVELQFSLRLASLAERVSVVARAPLVDTQRTVVSTVVTHAQIEALPINVRNFISFSLITPGVSADRTPQQGASATSGLTFAGQRARSNNITVDGVDNNDASVGGVRATFSQGAVQEFQVLMSSYSAEFGKASGGVVNIVTKSGTNRSSGEGFVYFRDESVSAKAHFEKFTPAGDPIDRAKAPFSQLQLGGVIGGPLQRDRTFYFMSLERLDIQASNFVTIDETDVVTVFGRPVGTAADILRQNGFPVVTGHVPYDVTSNQFLAKIDHHLRPNHQLSVRFNWAGELNENVEPWGGLVAQSRGALLNSDDVMVAASYTSVGSSKLVNELRGQVAYRNQNVRSLDPTCDGVCDRIDEGGPTLEVPGVASVGRHRFTPQPRRNIRYQVLDTLTYYLSRHRLKAGVDFNLVDNRASALPLHFGGRYIFQSLPAIPGVLPAPITGIQALALGLPAAYAQGYGNDSTEYATADLHLFAEDDWTLRDGLTLKLGLRYQDQFWPTSSFSVKGVGAYPFPADHNNFAPRLSAAWAPWIDRRQTSVHAAYGVFHDNQLTGLVGVGDILDGTADGVRTRVLRFPSTVPAWNAPGRRLPEPTTAYPSLIFVPDPSLRTPYAHHVAAGVNAEVRRHELSVNFVYVKGENQVGVLDYNPLVPELGAGRRPEDLIDPVAGVAVPGSSASVLQFTPFGETWYRGLTLSLAKRMSGRYQYQVSYTLSKAEDTSTDFQSNVVPENMGKGRDPNDPTGLPIGFSAEAERGPSVQDQRHRLVLSGLYSLPGAFQVSSIVTIGSGRPYNILAGTDLDGNGDAGAFPADRARRVPADAASSVSRNLGTMPWQTIVDLRISRRFRLRGRSTVDGLCEIFNLFNRTNFTEINNIFGPGPYPSAPVASFGRFEQAGSPLQVQLAMRVNF
jgi:hypothetical protein